MTLSSDLDALAVADPQSHGPLLKGVPGIHPHHARPRAALDGRRRHREHVGGRADVDVERRLQPGEDDLIHRDRAPHARGSVFGDLHAQSRADERRGATLDGDGSLGGCVQEPVQLHRLDLAENVEARGAEGQQLTADARGLPLHDVELRDVAGFGGEHLDVALRVGLLDREQQRTCADGLALDDVYLVDLTVHLRPEGDRVVASDRTGQAQGVDDLAAFGCDGRVRDA